MKNVEQFNRICWAAPYYIRLKDSFDSIFSMGVDKNNSNIGDTCSVGFPFAFLQMYDALTFSLETPFRVNSRFFIKPMTSEKKKKHHKLIYQQTQG